MSIHEIFKIDDMNPDEEIQIKLLAEYMTSNDTLDFKAPQSREIRRRNFHGKTLKTAVILHPDNLAKDGGLDSELKFILSTPNTFYKKHRDFDESLVSKF